MLLDDLEQQCEDALFELCDARERYPLRCAEELQKCIQLKNDIHVSGIYNFFHIFSLSGVLTEFLHITLLL